MKKRFQFLETRQGVLFQILEVQIWFASMILSVSHQLRFGKNCNHCSNTWKMTTLIGKMLTNKKSYEQNNKNILHLVLYLELLKPSWCNVGLNLTLKDVANSPCCYWIWDETIFLRTLSLSSSKHRWGCWNMGGYKAMHDKRLLEFLEVCKPLLAKFLQV